MEDAYARSVSEVLEFFAVDPTKGLTDSQLETPANLHCLLHTAMCSALCNESFIQYNPEKRNYEKIGESTEVALRVLAEKIGLPGFDSMPSALNMLSKHERASYCNRYWENQFKKFCGSLLPVNCYVRTTSLILLHSLRSIAVGLSVGVLS
ncbi:UNVERIFIED_CONTAM: Calcium-transporting ATPase 3, endoplasmic reticulum-type [Sesamum radiatum]|uniref:Calcium-transporting ATPase 3, endoplasmic reticulum-type n=1 Tax=Sesamum radiatum TaxID=300843 RepID=A0AAW2QFD1_SESRA